MKKIVINNNEYYLFSASARILSDNFTAVIAFGCKNKELIEQKSGYSYDDIIDSFDHSWMVDIEIDENIKWESIEHLDFQNKNLPKILITEELKQAINEFVKSYLNKEFIMKHFDKLIDNLFIKRK